MIQRLLATWLVCAGILFAVLRSPAPSGLEAHTAPAFAQVAPTPAPMVATESSCGSGKRLPLAGNPTALWEPPTAGAQDHLVGPYREGLTPDLPCGNRRLAAAR